MEFAPTGSTLVVRVATPEVLSVPPPMIVEPLLKDTVPVGIDPEPAITLAVKVTAVPCAAGLRDEVTVVVVVALSIVSVRAAELLAESSVLPL